MSSVTTLRSEKQKNHFTLLIYPRTMLTLAIDIAAFFVYAFLNFINTYIFSCILNLTSFSYISSLW